MQHLDLRDHHIDGLPESILTHGWDRGRGSRQAEVDLTGSDRAPRGTTERSRAARRRSSHVERFERPAHDYDGRRPCGRLATSEGTVAVVKCARTDFGRGGQS